MVFSASESSDAPRGALAAVTLLALALAAPTRPAERDPGDRLSAGVWRGEQGPWVVALEFARSGEEPGGVAHVIDGGRKWTEAPLSRVILEPPDLSFHLEWGASWQLDFRGRVDFATGTIRGELSSAGGPGQPMVYRQTDPAAVAGLPLHRFAAEEPRYEYRRPPQTDDGWKTATPGAVDLDRARVERLVEEIMGGAGGDIHSLLLVRHGLLVAEEYFNGWTRDDLHRIESCTKSVASLLVGIAIEQGLMDGVDAALLDFFPALGKAAAPGWEEVRLEHLLTMTVGLGRAASAGVETPGEALFRELLQSRLSSSPGATWQYANAEVDLLDAVFRQATGSDAERFAEAHLFGPLGIGGHEWSRSPEGHLSMAAGLALRPRDMARIGALVAAGGLWGRRRLVSADWISRSTRVHQTPRGASEQYGYLWWSAVPAGEPAGHRVAYAKGVGSQFIFVDPTLDLVVVTTGGNHANGQLLAVAELLSRQLLSTASDAPGASNQGRNPERESAAR